MEKDPIFARKARRLLGRIPATRIGIGVSGGADSVALLRLLHGIGVESGLQLHVFHVDHGLRAGSGSDAEWVRQLAERLSLPFFSTLLQPPLPGEISAMGGTEAWARRERFAAFSEMARLTGAETIALGHHGDDQAETVLMRLIRGASLQGIGGMRRVSVLPVGGGALRLWRPLLGLSRSEILAVLDELGQPWLTDETNADPRFLRNRIRSELIPFLESMRPGIARRISNLAGDLRDAFLLLQRRVRRVPTLAESPILETGSVKNALMLREMIKHWLLPGVSEGSLTRPRLQRLEELVREGRCGRRVQIDGGFVVRTASGLERVLPSSVLKGKPAKLIPDVPAAFADREFLLSRDPHPDFPNRIWVDPFLLGKLLLIRGRKPGDRFHPAKGRGGKKLCRWLIDRKIPVHVRESLTVVAWDDQIVWIPGIAWARGTAGSPFPDAWVLGFRKTPRIGKPVGQEGKPCPEAGS